MKILVSACLLGENCKYNGGNNFNNELAKVISDLQKTGTAFADSEDFEGNLQIIPVCPEVLGGLPIPRVPSEIVNGVVMNREGKNVDGEFRLGAERALEKACAGAGDLNDGQIAFAVLKANSPSCGFGQIYDGTFSGTKISGNGVFADLLVKHEIRIFTENQIEEIKMAIRR